VGAQERISKEIPEAVVNVYLRPALKGRLQGEGGGLSSRGRKRVVLPIHEGGPRGVDRDLRQKTKKRKDSSIEMGRSWQGGGEWGKTVRKGRSCHNRLVKAGLGFLPRHLRGEGNRNRGTEGVSIRGLVISSTGASMLSMVVSWQTSRTLKRLNQRSTTRGRSRRDGSRLGFGKRAYAMEKKRKPHVLAV